MKRGVLSLIRFIFGILILLFLIYKVGIFTILDTIKKINILYIIPASIILLISLFLGALGISVLLKKIKKDFNFFKLFKYYMISWFIGNFFPARIGDFSLVLFLKKENIKIEEGFAIFLIDKLITIIFLLIITTLSFFIFLNMKNALIFILILMATIVLFLLFILSKKGKYIIKKYFLRKYSKAFEGFSNIIKVYIKKGKKHLALNFFITLVRWINGALLIYILFIAFNQPVSFLIVFIITTITAFLALIPITIAGLGIRESSGVFLFSQFNIDSAITISVYIYALVIKYLILTLLISVILKTNLFKKSK